MAWWKWRARPGEQASSSPFDFSGSETYRRPRTGIDFFPVVPRYGIYGGQAPFNDDFVYATAVGQRAMGPSPSEAEFLGQFFTTVQFPGLKKSEA